MTLNMANEKQNEIEKYLKFIEKNTLFKKKENGIYPLDMAYCHAYIFPAIYDENAMKAKDNGNFDELSFSYGEGIFYITALKQKHHIKDFPPITLNLEQLEIFKTQLENQSLHIMKDLYQKYQEKQRRDAENAHIRALLRKELRNVE